MTRRSPLWLVFFGAAVALYFAFFFQVRDAEVTGEATDAGKAVLRIVLIFLGVATAFAAWFIAARRSPDDGGRGRRTAFAIVGGIAGTLVLGVLLTVADTAVSVVQGGFIERPTMREHEGDTEDNLRALYAAITLYHDSEDGYPPAVTWMDAIANRVKTWDMTEEEARKKFVNPDEEGRFGFAMNTFCSEMFVEDLPDGTILLFESASNAWNAHGDPERDQRQPARQGGNLAITVEGDVIYLD